MIRLIPNLDKKFGIRNKNKKKMRKCVMWCSKQDDLRHIHHSSQSSSSIYLFLKKALFLFIFSSNFRTHSPCLLHITLQPSSCMRLFYNMSPINHSSDRLLWNQSNTSKQMFYYTLSIYTLQTFIQIVQTVWKNKKEKKATNYIVKIELSDFRELPKYSISLRICINRFMLS